MGVKKFIPDADSDFAHMSRVFALHIANDPARYLLSASDAELITRFVTTFRNALAEAVRVSTRTKVTIVKKDEARQKAERYVRKYANLIRANEDISATDKMMVAIRERPRRLRRRKCPMRPPHLRFLGTDEGNPRIHVLEFREAFGCRSKAKPFGAVRLELFVDLITQGEPVPKYPGQGEGKQPWYLRSFTTNPIRVEFPMPKEPKLIVYWGRWADSTGEVGRWSETVIARVEGWSHAAISHESVTEVKPMEEMGLGVVVNM